MKDKWSYHIKGRIRCRDLLRWRMQEPVLGGHCVLRAGASPLAPPVVHVGSCLRQVEGAQIQLGHSQPWVIILQWKDCGSTLVKLCD